MNANFLETVLPTQGNYCAVGIGEGSTVQRFAETLDSLKEQAEKLISRNLNVYYALGTFEGHTRKAEECIYLRSFFVDLDCGEDKPYKNKNEALASLLGWVKKTGINKPTLVDSGGGIHAYWPFDQDIPSERWKPYAEAFKKFCQETELHIDPVVTADAARILRYPGSYNHRRDAECKVLTPIVVYAFDEFVERFGNLDKPEPEVVENVKDGSLKTINKYDNYEFDWETIKRKSLDGNGCAQIAKALTDKEACGYPLWWHTLSVALRCVDGDRVIHEISEGYPGYSYEETEKIARSSLAVSGAHKCVTFDKDSPGVCESCPRFGVINSPIAIGKVIRIAKSVERNPEPEETEQVEEPIRNKSISKEIPGFPEYLKPFMRGENGGIYYQPPAEYDKKTKKWVEQDPFVILTEDLYATKRLYSHQDGEMLQMRLHTPRDGIRDFLIAMKHVYSTDKFKEHMSGHGVFINPKYIGILMDYTIRWGKYLLNTERAEVMRVQMGWAEDMKSFIAGTQEITLDEIYECPPSPLSKSLSLNIKPEGSYELWRKSANRLNIKSLEIHAFTMLCGFGSALMPHTINAGAAVVLHGQKSGVGKTGALYAALSAWGNPKEMSVMENTDNGFTTRLVNLKNLPMGLDEQSNLDGKTLSQYVYVLNNGKPKIRMMSSINAERMVPMSAALIAIFTSNADLLDVIKDHRATPHGENARLLSFHMEDAPEVFKGRGQEIGAQIFHPFNQNYGHAGPMFIQEVLKAGQSTVKIYTETWEKRFREDYSQGSEYRFYTAVIAAAFAAGEILNKAGILELDLDRIYKEVVRKLKDDKDDDAINEADYESILGNYLNLNINNTLVINEGRLVTAPRNQLEIRVDVEESMVYVSKENIKKYLRTHKIQPKDFENGLIKSNLMVDRSRKKKIAAGWQPSLNLNVYCYVFATDVTKFVENVNTNRESAA